MVRIISALNPRSYPFLSIWYAFLEIRQIWMRMWIVVKRISGGYGSGYGNDTIQRIQIIRFFLRIIRGSQRG
jgi:hypothetical protein